MGTYAPKHTLVEAHQVTRLNREKLAAWIGGEIQQEVDTWGIVFTEGEAMMESERRRHIAYPGQWIVKEPPSFQYVLDNDEFERIYEQAPPSVTSVELLVDGSYSHDIWLVQADFDKRGYGLARDYAVRENESAAMRVAEMQRVRARVMRWDAVISVHRVSRAVYGAIKVIRLQDGEEVADGKAA